MIQNKDIVKLYTTSKFITNISNIDDKLVYIRKSEVTDEKNTVSITMQCRCI